MKRGNMDIHHALLVSGLTAMSLVGCSEEQPPGSDEGASSSGGIVVGSGGSDETGGASESGDDGAEGGPGGGVPGDDDGGDGGVNFDVGGVPEPPETDEDGCSKVDFLFVIDTSGSMGEEQDALKAAYPGFMQKIEASGIKDYHVAVTTADMGYCGGLYGYTGDNGEFMWQPANGDESCDPLAKHYIEGPSAASTEQFQCIAERFGGSGTEMPLQGAYAALVDRIQDGTNPVEFRRQDALLVVMYITDEDDQSALSSGTECGFEPISLYTQLYENAVLKGNPTAGVFIAISGPPEGYCSSGLGTAYAAPRIRDFINHWGPRGHWSNICNGNFPGALEAALETIEFGCDSFDPEG